MGARLLDRSARRVIQVTLAMLLVVPLLMLAPEENGETAALRLLADANAARPTGWDAVAAEVLSR
jgi:hypothetical protein